jgi:hypothetical protein
MTTRRSILQAGASAAAALTWGRWPARAADVPGGTGSEIKIAQNEQTAAKSKWRLSGDYFENCNCDVVCPCLFSSAAVLTSKPTQGVCHVAFVFHIDKGDRDGVALDGLNVAVVAHIPGAVGAGNWTLATYSDERADEKQTAALAAIFGGGEGGPMAAFVPLVGKNLGVKKAAIKYSIDGKARSAEIPGIMRLAVAPMSTLHPSAETWAATGYPLAPEKLAFAVGAKDSTFADYDMRWDNSGKNGFYAPISWSN